MGSPDVPGSSTQCGSVGTQSGGECDVCDRFPIPTKTRRREHPPSSLPDRWSSPAEVGQPAITNEPRPTRRSGHVAVIRHEYMYIYGGYDQIGLGHTFPELWRYHLLTERWNLVETTGIAPTTTCSQSAQLAGNGDAGDCMVVFGGTAVPFGANNGNDIHLYHFETREWSVVDDHGPKPVPRFGQATALGPDGRLWVLGGTDGFDFRNDIWVYDLRAHLAAADDDGGDGKGKGTGNVASRWTQIHNEVNAPRGRYKHEAFFHQDSIVVVGGGWPDPTPGTVIDKAHLFCTVSLNWREQQCVAADPAIGLPQARRSHTCTKVGRYVYLIGGTTTVPIASELVWRLDLESWAWTRLDGPNSGMPKPSFFHTCAVSPEGYLVTFAGVESSTNIGGTRERHTEVALFTPRQPLPTLQERCLQILVSNRECSRASLLAHGLPEIMVKRVVDRA